MESLQKVVNFFKNILDFDFVGAIRGIPEGKSSLRISWSY